MSERNTRQAKARRRAGRDRCQVPPGQPGHYGAVRDDGLGVTVHRADPAVLGRLAAGERLPRESNAVDVMHRMTGIPADEDPRLRPAVPDSEWRRDGG